MREVVKRPQWVVVVWFAIGSSNVAEAWQSLGVSLAGSRRLRQASSLAASNSLITKQIITKCSGEVVCGAKLGLPNPSGNGRPPLVEFTHLDHLDENDDSEKPEHLGQVTGE